MKCKCSLDNNYEIVGLCDLDDFNQKMCSFKDESWNQIKLYKILTIDEYKPKIKKIIKTFLDIKITSNQIVDTPKSNDLNIEGFNLTGKKLLVSGSISQRIIYTSYEECEKTHSIKFEENFNTYVVINEYSNPQTSKFCVYPFIENLSLKPLEGKNIYRNIDLFLFAHKIDLPIFINNEFIFYDYPNESTTKIVSVGLNGTNRTLIATNFNNPYNSQREDQYLYFELKNSRGGDKVRGRVNQNQTGASFVSALNDQRFELGDIIEINYQKPKNIKLTNYPSLGDEYDMTFIPLRKFKITDKGIVPHVLPNVIVLKAMNGTRIFTLAFDISDKVFLPYVISAILPEPTASDKYFGIIVKGSNLVQKYSVSINGNQNTSELVNALFFKEFEYGDTIELSYKDGSKVEITDYPYPTSTKSNLAGTTSKTYKITQAGLVSV